MFRFNFLKNIIYLRVNPSRVNNNTMVVTLEEINAKLDKIIFLLNEKFEDIEDAVNHEWTADIVGNFILITFPFNTEFKNFIKSIGGFWNRGKKGWMFRLLDKDTIVNQIKNKFPYWLFINNLIID